MKKLVLSAILFATSLYATATTPRLEWANNSGYCGEVSLITAGLNYGQYISQYDARVLIANGMPQNVAQLLLGTNDQTAAALMHLNCIYYTPSLGSFLPWVQANVAKGYPVAIGVFLNEYLFYTITDPNAGDPDYDHIVPVVSYTDKIIISDSGLWQDADGPPYLFTYDPKTFPATRQQANSQTGPIYSLQSAGTNYGIAITGVMDDNGDTLPINVQTDSNCENPPIADQSNTRPSSMTLNLTITVSGLTQGVTYNIYRYNDLTKVPHSKFNGQSGNAFQHWQINATGTTYVMNQQIQSNEMAIYRAVKATAP